MNVKTTESSQNVLKTGRKEKKRKSLKLMCIQLEKRVRVYRKYEEKQGGKQNDMYLKL